MSSTSQTTELNGILEDIRILGKYVTLTIREIGTKVLIRDRIPSSHHRPVGDFSPAIGKMRREIPVRIGLMPDGRTIRGIDYPQGN